MSADSDLRRGFEFGPFTVIPERGIVRKDGEDVHLEPKQMDALVTLARHQPNVVSKDLLVEEVWGGRATADESIVQCIKGIRQALDKDDPRDPKYVETIQRRGYRLMVPLKVADPEAAEPAGMQVPRTWVLGGAVAIVALVIAWMWPQGPGSRFAEQSIDSLVVMRFVNLSDEPHFADGFTEQLVSTLHQVQNLRTKTGRLPTGDELSSDIADEYAVLAVVQGSVQHVAGQLKVSASIVDSEDINLWADTFDGTTDQLFELHEMVANAVLRAITGTTGETVTPSSQPENSAAYLRYLLGRSQLAKRDPASLQAATETFMQSIETDPGYGPAYLALANSYVLRNDYADGDTMFGLAIATLDEGVRIDRSIEEPAKTFTGYVSTKSGEWMAASAAFASATTSATEYPPSQHYYSRFLAAVGRLGDSLDAAIAAWEMDRENQVLNSRLAIAHMWNNDMEAARQYYEIANAKGEGAPVHLMSYAMFLIRDQRMNEARAVARRAMTLYKEDVTWVDPVFDELEKDPLSESTLAVLEEYSARGVIPPPVLITFWVLAEQVDQAMMMTRRLVDDADYFEIELIYLDEFRILREHADFPQFLDDIGLTAYWESVGCEWTVEAVVCN